MGNLVNRNIERKPNAGKRFPIETLSTILKDRKRDSRRPLYDAQVLEATGKSDTVLKIATDHAEGRDREVAEAAEDFLSVIFVPLEDKKLGWLDVEKITEDDIDIDLLLQSLAVMALLVASYRRLNRCMEAAEISMYSREVVVAIDIIHINTSLGIRTA